MTDRIHIEIYYGIVEFPWVFICKTIRLDTHVINLSGCWGPLCAFDPFNDLAHPSPVFHAN
jgi:hypothetical protein